MRARMDRRTPDGLRSHLATASSAELRADLRLLDERALDRWLADRETARIVVESLVSRFDDVADPERRRLLDGRATFAVRGSEVAETVVFGTGQGAAVHIIAPAPVLVRLLSGAGDAALLHLAGDLDIEGDATLALDIGGALQIPGEGRAAVDPTSLDPVDVATACARASVDHLHAVMRGGFRDVVLGEVFRRFPDFVDADRARRTTMSVVFAVGGRADGGADHRRVVLERGVVTVEDHGDQAPPADATLVLDGAGFLRLVTGQLHPVHGVLTGAVRVRGDRAKALTFNQLMTPPRPRGR
ncbi:hypothetical protein GCM10027425_19240 [Alteromonas gracilis]